MGVEKNTGGTEVSHVLGDTAELVQNPQQRDTTAQAFDTLANLIPETVARFDAQCRRTYVNAAFARAVGVPAQALLGQRPSDLRSTPQALAYEQAIRDVFADGLPREHEYAWTDKDGKLVISHARLVAERDASGTVVSVLSAGCDMAPLRRTQQHLQEAQTRLSKILQILPDLVWLTDVNGAFLACNAAVERWLGTGEQNILGRRYHDLLPAAWADKALEHDAQTLASGQMHVSVEWGRFADDGLEVLFETRRIPMLGPDGDAIGVLAVARDVTQQQKLAMQLASREEEFRTLAENFPDCIVRYDCMCRRIYVNPAFIQYSGMKAHQALGKTPQELSHLSPDSAAYYQQRLQQVIETGVADSVELEWEGLDGRHMVQQIAIVPERDALGQLCSVLAIGRDITAFKESEQRLKEAEGMAHLGHWHWDFRHKTNMASDEVCRILGMPSGWSPSRSEIFGKMAESDRARVFARLEDAIAAQATDLSLDYRIQVAQRFVDVHTNMRIRYDSQGKPAQLLGTTQDVTELRAYQQQLHTLTHYDTLTLLPNRDLLRRHIEQAVAHAAQHQLQAAVMILDLDNFKVVNDSMGHAVGDLVLKEVAQRIKACVGGKDIVARLSGDEFALLLCDVASDADVSDVARKVLDAVAKNHSVNGQGIFVSASIGIARFPQDSDQASTLLQFADAAMHHAKEQGKDNVQFYSAAFTARTSQRLVLTSDLRHAIAHQEMRVFYQPKMALAHGGLVGAEALLRWNHPSQGSVAPDAFIPIAEETGLILDIGRSVLRTACLAVCRWNAHRSVPLRVAVNLSSRQFRAFDLVGMVESVLEETGCKPQWLELEITESLLLKDSCDVARTLAHFASMGITLAIDDFGTGYSSLAYLNRFPIHTLKVDKSFIANVTAPAGSAPLVQAILSMSKSLHMSVVAEGVETEEQARWLVANGCELAQGYLWGKPMPEADFVAMADAAKQEQA